MKRFVKLYIGLFIIVGIVIAGFIYMKPKETLATMKTYFEVEEENETYKTVKFYFQLNNGDRKNIAIIDLTLTELEVEEVTPLNDFVKYDDETNEQEHRYAFASNKVYSNDSRDNIDNAEKIYFAKIKFKKLNVGCNLSISPDLSKNIINTNNFTLKKEAYKDGDKIADVKVGEEFIYRLTVTGNNDLPSDKVTITDTIPDDLQIMDAGKGKVNGQTITWEFESFPKGSKTETLEVRVKALKENNRVVNKATLKVGDKTLEDEEDVSIVDSHITIEKTASVTKVSNGNEYYYTLTVKNTGRGKSENVVVEDTLDDNLELVNIDRAYTNEGNKYTINLGEMEANQTITIKVTVKVKDDNEKEIINNKATAKEGEKTPSEDEVTVDVLKPNLSVEKTASVETVKRGNTFNYVIKVVNNGEGNALNVDIKDKISDNFEITRMVPNNHEGNVINVHYDKILPHETKTITITVKAKEEASLGEVSNTVTVTSDNNDDVKDDANVEIVDSNITIEKTASKAVLQVGEEFSYTLTVKNTGKATSSVIVVTDVIDSNLEIMEATGASRNGQTLTWTIPSLSPSEARELTIKVKTKKITSSELTIPNTAVAKENGKAPVDDNYPVVVKKPNLSITKEALKYNEDSKLCEKVEDSLVVRPNEKYCYEIKVQNNSEVNALDVLIEDEINELLEIVDAKNASSNGQKLSWHEDVITAGEVKTYEVVVKPKENINESITIPNVAILTYNEEEKEASVTVPVIKEDIYIIKKAQKKKLTAGETFKYVLTIGNRGDDYNDTITVSDNLREELTFVKYTYPEKVTASQNENNLTFNISGLKKNESINIEIEVKVKENVKKDTKINNVAILTYDDKEVTSEDDVTVIGPIIKVKKLASVNYITKDEEFYYTIEVSNEGEVPAYNLIVTDTFDNRLEILDNASGVVDENTITWNIDVLNGGETRKFRIKAVLHSILDVDDIINNVVVTVPNEEDKTAEVENPVLEPTFSIRKEVSKTRVVKGEEFEYYIILKNESNIAIDNIVINDTIHDNLEIIGAENLAVEVQVVKGITSLAPNEEKKFTIKVRVLNDDIEEIPNSAVATYKEQTKNSNEVIVEVSVINPKTGTINRIILSIMGITILVGGTIYLNKRKVLYKI